MRCFVFPGQPLARTDLPLNDPLFDDLAIRCRSCTGFDPRQADAGGPDIPESVRLQLYGVTMSLYRFNQLLRQVGPPDIVAEHSMGIYPALAASESIGFSDAFSLAFRIGTTLAAMGGESEYALACVVGLAAAPVEEIVGRRGIHVANYNTSRHFLLAGERERIELAAVEAEAAGAFSVALFPCDAPLHTPLVGRIADRLDAIIAEYRFQEPVIPLVDHLEQRLLSSSHIPGFLLDELCRPVFWEATYRTLRSRGVTAFHEVGHGAALTKFNRWIDSQP